MSTGIETLLTGFKAQYETDNLADTYFQAKKKLSPKLARWQEFLQEYDFLWEHKHGRHNLVSDAISWKMVTSMTTILASLSRIETNFTARVLEQSEDDAAYQHL